MVKKKKMLTVEDLCAFCIEHNFAKFSAKESGYQLAVQVPTTFEIDDTSDDNHRGMMRLKFRILHDGKNRNGSFVSHSSAVKASNTIADRPIMAAIHQLDDGSWDFKSHEMEIIENEDGEAEINYIEKQVGSFSSEKPFWEHDDELDKDYLCAYGYIAEEYTKAADIIRNKGWTKNSCELSIEELAYNARENYLELKSFYLSASTLLGKRDDGTEIGEGMLGSRADIADFSEKNNSIFSSNEKVIEMLSALNEKIDNLNINQTNSKEGGKDLVKKNFEENIEEEINDAPSTEVFDGEEGGDGTDDGVDYYEDPVDETEDSNGETVNDDESDPEPSDDGDEGSDGDDEESGIPLGQRDDDDEVGSGKKYSISVNDGEKTLDFSISLQDKIEALYTLVNDTYAEADGCYYDCTVYDEDKYVIMSSWWTGDAYKQSYKVKKDVYSLVGDRVRVKAVYVTEDEEKALENMRANYSSIVEELTSFREEPKKQEVLNEECYSQISETDAYKELAKQESHFSMSIDEIRAELDRQLLEYAKGNEIKFSAENTEKKTVGVKRFGNPLKKGSATTKNRYGGIFKK